MVAGGGGRRVPCGACQKAFSHTRQVELQGSGPPHKMLTGDGVRLRPRPRPAARMDASHCGAAASAVAKVEVQAQVGKQAGGLTEREAFGGRGVHLQVESQRRKVAYAKRGGGSQGGKQQPAGIHLHHSTADSVSGLF